MPPYPSRHVSHPVPAAVQLRCLRARLCWQKGVHVLPATGKFRVRFTSIARRSDRVVRSKSWHRPAEVGGPLALPMLGLG
jgi:hypothetical protein